MEYFDHILIFNKAFYVLIQSDAMLMFFWPATWLLLVMVFIPFWTATASVLAAVTNTKTAGSTNHQCHQIGLKINNRINFIFDANAISKFCENLNFSTKNYWIIAIILVITFLIL